MARLFNSKKAYPRIIGLLIFSMVETRSVIAFSILIISRFSKTFYINISKWSKIFYGISKALKIEASPIKDKKNFFPEDILRPMIRKVKNESLDISSYSIEDCWADV